MAQAHATTIEQAPPRGPRRLDAEAGAAAVEAYLQDFEAFRRERGVDGGGEPAALAELRRAAIERFGELGFPTTRQEEWRFTSVAPIARTRFRRAGGGEAAGETASEAGVAADAVALHGFDSGSRLVFVDGRFAPDLSRLAGLPDGAAVTSLARALAESPGRVEPHLARHARFDEHPFVALNSAFFTDGAFVEIPAGAAVTEPIQILHLATGGKSAAGEPPVIYPRNLIVAGENSQSIVVETFAGVGSGASFTCAVTEVVAEPNAVLDHSKVQKESVEAFHMATTQIHQDRSSNLFSHSISTGGALVRNDVNAVLDGEGVECTLNGIYVLRGNQFLDNHMRVDHAKPHGSSYELFKGILDEKARAVFNGRIFVAKGAQKTDAKQSSRNLLLSREALVNANPQLEIFADDVKCTHGSTVGQLDDEAIFYLRSRGIGAEAARSLLTFAFAADIVDRIKVEPVKRELTEFLFHRLPRGEVVRQAV